MLHGWGQSYQCFMPLIEKLNNNFHIFALDLPGFGKSEEPNFPYTIYDYANYVLAFIKKLDINEYNLVAHSFGGRISIILANQDQNHIKKMVLTGAAGIKPKKTWRQKLSVYHYKFMKLLTKTPIFCQWHKDLITNSGSPDYRQASPMMKQVLTNTVNEDLTPLLNNINQEVLLYWGDDDDQTPLVKRDDDQPEKVQTRIEVSLDTMQAMLDYYQAQNKLSTISISQEDDVLCVFSKIEEVLNHD